MPYVLRTRPDLDTRPERRYSWILVLLLLIILGTWLVSSLILSD